MRVVPRFAWLLGTSDTHVTITNDGTVEQLYEKLDRLMRWIDTRKRIAQMARRLGQSKVA